LVVDGEGGAVEGREEVTAVGVAEAWVAVLGAALEGERAVAGQADEVALGMAVMVVAGMGGEVAWVMAGKGAAWAAAWASWAAVALAAVALGAGVAAMAGALEGGAMVGRVDGVVEAGEGALAALAAMVTG
jgi:hypothetical protein